jgi:hypothetical protein
MIWITPEVATTCPKETVFGQLASHRFGDPEAAT